MMSVCSNSVHLIVDTAGDLLDCNPGNGLVVETYLGRVEIKNSWFLNNYGNGVKAKFLDGRFVIVDQLLTFCKMANPDTQTFPQLITGIRSFSTSCGRVSCLHFCKCSTYSLMKIAILMASTTMHNPATSLIFLFPLFPTSVFSFMTTATALSCCWDGRGLLYNSNSENWGWWINFGEKLGGMLASMGVSHIMPKTGNFRLHFCWRHYGSSFS